MTERPVIEDCQRFNQKERRERTWAYIANKRSNEFIKESQEKGAYHDEIGTAAVEFYSD